VELRLVGLDARKCQKPLGQYNTPPSVAREIARWAVAVTEPFVFEPSFGGCVFLVEALKSMQKRGVPTPEKRLFGVDIDPSVRENLQPVFAAGAEAGQFLTGDFFSVAPTDFRGGKRFSSVIGNPPYVRHHTIPRDMKQKAQSTVEGLSGRASLWAHFLLHGLDFLRKGGRLGFVLPGSFLHADYAAPVRTRVFSHFRSVLVGLITRRVFHDAQEQTIVLLASGWGETGRDVRLTEIDGPEDLQGIVDRLLDGEKVGQPIAGESSSDLRSSLVPESVRTCLSSLPQTEDGIKQLGDVARIGIGVVTGANDYFIVRPSRFVDDTPETFLVPTITRAHLLRGLELTRSDLDLLSQEDVPSMLLSLAASHELPPALQEYLEVGKRLGIDQRYKCRHRDPWFRVPRTYAPEAFLTYMTAGSPRITLNRTRATGTNAVHRLRPKSGYKPLVPYIALGSVTTLFQASAELFARSYGGGVLKLEIGEAKKLLLPIRDWGTQGLFERVDSLLRRGLVDQATGLVDEELVVKGLGLSWEVIDMLAAARDTLRQRRQSIGGAPWKPLD